MVKGMVIITMLCTLGLGWLTWLGKKAEVEAHRLAALPAHHERVCREPLVC